MKSIGPQEEEQLDPASKQDVPPGEPGPLPASEGASFDLDPSPAAMLGDRRLLLVSNREPYVRKQGGGEPSFKRTAGGLVTALDPVMRRCGGVWVAWEPGGDLAGAPRYQVPAEPPQFTLRQVPLSSDQVRGYYHGFANRALWPLCHYFIDRCHFDERDWRHYEQVNRRFAEVVADEALADDLVWIQDYHFCLLPEMVRELRATAAEAPADRAATAKKQGASGPIAFFLHIPFPSQEVFRVLPWHKQLLRGLLGADLVAFHVDSYADNFLDCCAQLVDGAKVDRRRGTVRWQGRTVYVGAYPIGIDVDEFEALARRDDVAELAGQIRRNIGTPKVILGVDRLDYSKGILERLKAFDVLLRKYPQHRAQVTFLQIAVPSRERVQEYRDLKSQIDELVGRINGRYARSAWQPIRYLYRSLPRPELVAHYCATDIALVTPLRDGMNLVAKEFCACRTDGDGVLVLSEMTGAAEALGEGAVTVNPFSAEEVADAIHLALTMDEDERRRRMSILRSAVAEDDINNWLARILSDALGHTGSRGVQVQ